MFANYLRCDIVWFVTTRELIEDAFADVSYPGDDNIADHQHCPECDDVRAFFRGKSWRGLRFPELHYYHESLPLLTLDALHYFLPGYMIATLENWDQADMISYGIIAIGGYPGDAQKVKNQAREKRKIFSVKQREAIAEWLRELSKFGSEELRDNEDIKYAAKLILED